MLDLMRSEASWARFGPVWGALSITFGGHADNQTQRKTSRKRYGQCRVVSRRGAANNASLNNVWLIRKTTHLNGIDLLLGLVKASPKPRPEAPPRADGAKRRP